MSYAVVRTDNMAGTTVGSKLVTLKVGNPLENGNVVSIDDMYINSHSTFGDRESYMCDYPTSKQKLGKLVLVAGVELMYDERKKNLDEFINKKDSEARGYIGDPEARGYILTSGDIFSVTAEAFDTTPAVGKFVETEANSYKWKVVSEETDAVAKIVAIENNGGYTFYVLRVL